MSKIESRSLRPPTGVRIVQWLTLVGLSIGLAFVVDLLLLTFLPDSHGLFERLFTGRAPTVDASLPIALGLIVLSPVLVGFIARRLPLRSLRGWVRLGLVVTGGLVANLVLCAQFPSVLDGFAAVMIASFWKVNGVSVGLVSFTLAAIGYVTWRVRPRSLRSGATLALSIGFILCLDLVLVAYFPPLDGVLNGLSRVFFLNVANETLGDVEIILFLIVVVPLAIFAILWLLRRHSWWWIGGGYLALVPLLAYLAIDDSSIRRPVPLEAISPPFPGAEKSFAVLMRYSRQRPLGRDFHAPQRFYENIKAGEAIVPGKPEQWLAWLTAHRADIEADWSDLAPVRNWWSELNTFDRIGDLTPAEADFEMLAFSPVRSLCQHACAIASLQALDGQGDTAIDTLLPILQVGRKLQPSSRTLVRQMVGIITERMSITTAGFVLDHATISPAARARLTAALAASGDGAFGARHIMASEYAFGLALNLHRPLGDIVLQTPDWRRTLLNVVSPFVYNRRATFNLYGEFAADEEELLARRQLVEVDSRSRRLVVEDARPRFKNLLGAQFLRLMVPAFSKIGESYWSTQDNRAALLARLAKTSAKA